MRTKLASIVTFILALAAAPLYAQSSPGQPASNAAQVHHVVGTVASLTGEMLEVKVESAPGEAQALATSMVGNIESFTLGPDVARPADLRNGDRVDVWFTSDTSVNTVVRIAEASATSTEAPGQSSVGQPGSGQSGTPAAAGAQPATQPAASGVAPQTATGRERLPKTGSSLPLIGLIGVGALAVGAALRFSLRG